MHENVLIDVNLLKEIPQGENLQMPAYLFVIPGSISERILGRLCGDLAAHGLDLPNVAFLAIDTARPSLPAGVTFVHLALEDDPEVLVSPRGLALHPYLLKWLPHLPQARSSIVAGPGAAALPINALVRLLRKIDEVEGALRNLMGQVTSGETEEVLRRRGITLRRELRVGVIASPLGGTAPALTLPVAYLARSLARERNLPATVEGLVILPVEEELRKLSPAQRVRAQRNLYFFAGYHDTYAHPDRLFCQDYGSGRKIETSLPPFDLCYLVDSTCQDGGAFTSLEEVAGFVSRLLSGYVTGNLDQAYRARLLDSMSLTQDTVLGKPRRYATPAFAGIFFPAPELAGLFTYRLSLDLVDGLLRANPQGRCAEARQKAEELARVEGLSGEALLQKLPQSSPQKPPQEVYKTKWPHLPTVLGQWMMRMDQEYEEFAVRLKGEADQVLEQLQGQAGEWFERAEEERPGMDFVPAFRAELLGHLRGECDGLEKQKEAAERSLEATETELERLRQKLARAAGGLQALAPFMLIQLRNRIVNLALDCNKHRSRLLRAEESRRILSGLIQAVGGGSSPAEQTLREIRGSLEHLRDQAHSRLEALIDRGGYWFPALEKGEVEPLYRRYAGELAGLIASLQQSYAPLSEWGRRPREEVMERILQTASQRFKPILELSIAEVLAEGVLPGCVRLEEMIERAHCQLRYRLNLDLTCLPRESSLPKVVTAAIGSNSRSFQAVEKVKGVLEEQVSPHCIVDAGFDRHSLILMGVKLALPLYTWKGLSATRKGSQEACATMDELGARVFAHPPVDPIPDFDADLDRARFTLDQSLKAGLIAQDQAFHHNGTPLGECREECLSHLLQTEKDREKLFQKLVQKAAGELLPLVASSDRLEGRLNEMLDGDHGSPVGEEFKGKVKRELGLN